MKKTIRDIEVKGKRVIVGCDFNVPMKKGVITDDTRIQAALPTIRYLVEQGARVILMSHLGRPEGEPKMEFTLKPVADALTEALGKDVVFISSATVVDDDVKKAAAELKDGDVMLLENVRFRKEETKNGADFAAELASLADIFVQEAFGTAHRAHASTAGIAAHLPAVSGFLIEKEVKFLGDALENPERPLVGILGGSKVKDKIAVIRSLLEKVDTLLIGGGMMFTFLKAEGCEIGRSILDADNVDLARELMDSARQKGVKLMLPVDIVCAEDFDNNSPTLTCACNEIPKDMMGMDIGPMTVKMFGIEIAAAKTVIWNGPMGVFEMPNFAAGTEEIAKALADCGAITIIGGGDSSAAIKQFGLEDQMTHISTGGGASLEFLEGKELPGIAVIEDVQKDKEQRTGGTKAEPGKRTPFIAGNWKMFKTMKEAAEFAEEFKKTERNSGVRTAVCAPFTQLQTLKEAFKGTDIGVGAQNVHFEDEGAFTGEVSLPMLKELELDYCIIGHSERREYFNETDETVNLKLKKILNESAITPILCVGENLEQRENGRDQEIVSAQLKADFDQLTPEQAAKTVIAYEPIWAIGTGKTATPEQAEEMCGFIRKTIAALFDEKTAEAIIIQYGGSVKPENAAEIMKKENIDGALVGGASLIPEKFAGILNF